MFAEIEEKIVERLNTKLSGVHRVAIDEAHSPLSLSLPGVDVIVGGGSFSRIAQHYKVNPSVFVIVTFQNLRSVRDRRKGVYPILQSIMALLIGQRLGLKIDALVPRRLDNITEREEAEQGKVVFQMEFETGFVIQTQSDEDLTDLLKIGLNYYLALPDGTIDDTADASDIVNLSGT